MSSEVSVKWSCFCLALVCAVALHSAAWSETVPVRIVQHNEHRWMVTRSATGQTIARHEFSQVVQGNQVTMHLAYYFTDGSLDDEVTTYTQQGTFRLVRDHHIQKGPFFTRPVDYTIDCASGTVTISTTDRNGRSNVQSRHVAMPDDLANGLIGVLLLNEPRNAKPLQVSMLAPVGGGRLVQITITQEGEQQLRMAGSNLKATVYRVHPELGGIVGLIARLIGVQPKDVLVWVAEGADPAVVKIVGQLGGYGPIVTSYPEGIGFGSATLADAIH